MVFLQDVDVFVIVLSKTWFQAFPSSKTSPLASRTFPAHAFASPFQVELGRIVSTHLFNLLRCAFSQKMGGRISHVSPGGRVGLVRWSCAVAVLRPELLSVPTA